MLIRPFKFLNIFDYVKNFEKAVEFYSVFGGTPAYLMEIDKNRDIITNIRSKILREDVFIYRDV